MANPNPWKARLAKRRQMLDELSAGDLDKARRILWAVVLDATDRMADHAIDNDDFSRLSNAVVRAVSEYRQLVEVGEIEQRLAEVERRQRARSPYQRVGTA